MAGLKSIPDGIKAKAFDLIVESYDKDTDLSGFGKDVQEILQFIRKMYCR